MAIKRAIDEEQIAGPATCRADGKFPRQMRLSAGREGSDLFVLHMKPPDLALPADSIGQPNEAVT
jgi:hypothetical protein